MAQQTAVEWFVNSVFAKNGLIIYAELIEQAKAMEKEQMIEFGKWMRENDTVENAERYFHYSYIDMINEYYNKTYKTSNHDND